MIETEKFYLFDVGITNFLAKREPKQGNPEFSKSFEQIMLMELLAYKANKTTDLEITFWRASNKQEVDFILDDFEVRIEIKSSSSVHEGDIRYLTVYADSGHYKKKIVVCDKPRKRIMQDYYGKILIYPWRKFVTELWASDII